MNRQFNHSYHHPWGKDAGSDVPSSQTSESATNGRKIMARATFIIGAGLSTIVFLWLVILNSTDIDRPNRYIIPFATVRFAFWIIVALGDWIQRSLYGRTGRPFFVASLYPPTPSNKELVPQWILEFGHVLRIIVAWAFLLPDFLGALLSIVFLSVNPKNDAGQYAMGNTANIVGTIFYLLLCVVDSFHVAYRPDPTRETSSTSSSSPQPQQTEMKMY